jgi:predicted transcriptional regulator
VKWKTRRDECRIPRYFFQRRQPLGEYCSITLDIAKSCSILNCMRTTKTLSVTLPPEMLTRAEQLAKKEHRTMSELVREALRQYERRNWWDEMNAYGRVTAEAAAVRNEKDVVEAIHSTRSQGRTRRKPFPK